MRINVAVPEAHVSRPILDAALEATTRVNQAMLEAGEVPLFDEVKNRIRWKPEPPGDEHFDHAGVVVGRRWGDCDDMAPYAAASMRHTGEDPGAKAIVKRSGPTRWHAVVLKSDGSIRDPSRETGMGQTNGVLGAALPLMMRPQAVVGGSYIARPQLALRPIRDRSGEIEAWQARADLPWHWAPGQSPTDVAMASLHASPVSSEAIVGACAGLLRLGDANDVDEECLTRAEAIMHAADGVPWEDLADEYGPEHATAAGQVVGSFFGGLVKKAASAFGGTPLGTMASFIPGMPASKGASPGMMGRPGMSMPGGTDMPIMQMKSFLAQNPQFAPLAKTLLPMAGMAFGPLGAMGGNMLAQFVTPQQAAYAHASPDLQANLQQGFNMPPPSGGGFNPMSMFGGMMPGMFGFG